jgi:hypothetical protein
MLAQMTPDSLGDPLDEALADSGSTAAAEHVEFDAEQARTWVLAASSGDGGTLAQDDATGVFGNRVALLDFDPEDLDRLRRLVPSVRLVAHPALESAIAISGSSAQGKVQLFPGDADFFERAHIRADTEAQAQVILRDAMRATALRALAEPDVVLVEVNLGVYGEPVLERGSPRGAGDPITWTPADVAAGVMEVETPGGEPRTIAWDGVEIGAGWVYLGWIVADREAGRIALASVMVDATWENPAGEVRSLDGAVDPVAQEVYLEAGALPLVERLSAMTAPDARNSYRDAMRGEAHHYTAVEPNFAKAAKRLYNLFRVADELEAAAYVRELFDEPTARLYQVPGLLEAADVALDPESGIDRDTVLRQLDVVAAAIADVTDGADEGELLAELGRLRDDALDDGRRGESWAGVLADVRARAAVLVNAFFRERLLAHDRVREVVDELAND